MATKVAITAIASFYLCHWVDQYLQHPVDLITGLWCVLASIIVLQNNIGGTYKAIWNRFLGVVIGSIIGAFFAFGIGTSIEVLGLAVFLTTILCSVLGIQDCYRIASLSVAIIMIPWQFHPDGDPWIYAFFRFLDTCLGFIVAIAVSHFIWPSQAVTKMRQSMADSFILFREYFEHTLNFPQVNPRKDKIYKGLIKDINQAFKESRVILEELKVEVFIQLNPLDKWIDLFNLQEKLWDHFRAVQDIYSLYLSEIFDLKLKKKFHEITDEINLVLRELSLKLKKIEQSKRFDFTQLNQLQYSLTQELIRFRSTRTIKKYQLEIVENYYVFFYQMKQILVLLQKFNHTLDQ